MVVVYVSDKNLYDKIPTAINSLLVNNHNVDQIYILSEDDDIDILHHPKIKIINISNSEEIIKSGINCTKRFPYMTMARCFIPLILKEHKVLYLDIDTIVDNNLDYMWNHYGNNSALTGYPEYKDYLNSGCLIMNLDIMRSLNRFNILKKLLLTCRLQFPDQDALNMVYKGSKEFFNYEYNTIGDIIPELLQGPLVIRHFAGIIKPWQKGATEENIKIWNKYFKEKL